MCAIQFAATNSMKNSAVYCGVILAYTKVFFLASTSVRGAFSSSHLVGDDRKQHVIARNQTIYKSTRLYKRGCEGMSQFHNGFISARDCGYSH